MREVVLKLTSQKDVIKHQSEATTFGALKRELRQVSWSGMRVVERSSKATLQMDDAVLPQGDFILFLVPEKVKSGKKTSGGASELSGPIEDCKYNELRSHISWLNREKNANLPMSGGTPDLQKVLKKYYKDGGTVPKASKAAPKANAADAVKAVEEAKKYKPTPRENDEDDEDYNDRIAFEEKAFNKKEKKRIAKLEEERKAKEAAEKKAAEEKAAKEKKAPKKKGIVQKVKEAFSPSDDPIEKIQTARNNINEAVDEIVQGHLSGAAPITPGGPLEYTLKGLEKELNEVHKALRTSRSQAKYID